jgi:RNA polymerase sigma factor (sigma-70 family)
VARTFSTEDADDVVAEAYLRILSAVRNGKGPTAGFRPYLFTTIRNVAAAWGQRRLEHPLEDATTIPDPGSTEEASLEALDRSLTLRAFRSLPERWQEVLWYTEVEQLTAAAVAPLLGLTPNSTAALAYRAREGLRQAWIQAHIAASPEGSEHQWTIERVGAYTRGGLGKRETARMERHLAECAKCSIVAAEARNVGSRLTLVLLPLILGIGGASAYAAAVRAGAAATAAGAAGVPVAGAGAAGVQGAGTQVAGTQAAGTHAAGTHAAGVQAAGTHAAGVQGAGTHAAGTHAAGTPAAGAPSAAAPVSSPAGAAAPAVRGARRLLGRGGRAGVVAGSVAAGVLVATGIAGAVTLGPQLFARSSVTEAPSRQDAAAPAPAPETEAPSSSSQPPTAQSPATPPPPAAPPAPETPTPPVLRSVPQPAIVPLPPVVTPPVSVPVPPAAPAVLTSFPPGWETAATTLPVDGTGLPGATVALTAPGHSGDLGTATVAPDGTWTLTADISALADGSWTLSAVQRTATGTSAPATFTLAIDRTALPPAITAVDTGSGADAGKLAPVLTGTAEPGAVVEVFDGGTTVATVTADATGAWTTPELIAIPVDYALTARQTDRLGNVSALTAPTTGPALVPTVTASGSAGLVTISVQGDPGTDVDVWADGRQTPYTLTLDATGRADAVYSWTAGDHRIGVVARYGTRHGVLSDVPVTLP